MTGPLLKLIEIAIDGIASGLLMALLGAGITLVFGLGEVLNLAQGIFAVIGALVALEALNSGFPIPVALVVGITAIALLAFVVDWVLLGRVYQSDADVRILIGIFVTLGLTLIIEGVLFQLYPYQFSLPIDIPTFRTGGLTVLGASLLNIVVASIVLTGLFFFLQRTYLGKAARTITQDEVGALLCGVDARRMRALIFVLSAALAAVAGILHGIGTNLSASSGFELTVQALIVSIVGGVRDVRGTVVAGLGLGLVLAFSNYFIGTYISLIAMFVAATIALVVRQEDIA